MPLTFLCVLLILILPFGALQYNQLATGTAGGSNSNLGLKIGLPVAIGCVLAALLCCCCAFGCMVSGNSKYPECEPSLKVVLVLGVVPNSQVFHSLRGVSREKQYGVHRDVLLCNYLYVVLSSSRTVCLIQRLAWKQLCPLLVVLLLLPLPTGGFLQSRLVWPAAVEKKEE